MQQPMRRRRVLAMVMSLAMLAGTFGGWRGASAQYLPVFDELPFNVLVGIEEAIQRLYQGAPSIHIYAGIARFDSVENAELGHDTLERWFVDAFAAAGTPLAFEPVAVTTSVAGARAFFDTTDLGPGTDPYAEATMILAQIDPYVHWVVVVNDYGGGVTEMSQEVAVAMIEAMTTAPAVQATPGATPVDPSGGATWEKFPKQEDAVPQRYGITYTEDTTFVGASIPETPEVTPEASMPGAVWGGSRDYENEDGDTALVMLVVFDDEDNATAGYAELINQFGGDLVEAAVDFEQVDAEVDADEAVAFTVSFDDEGVPATGALVVVRSGLDVILVGVGTDDDEDVLTLARDLARSVLDADAGDGEVVEDNNGFYSGGHWDRFPDAGDESLKGRTPVRNEQLAP